MPLGDILKQPQRLSEARNPRAEMASSVLGMLNPALGVAQGANDFLSGAGAAGLGMAAAGAIPGVPGNMDDVLEEGAKIASEIARWSKVQKIEPYEGLMDYLDMIGAEGGKVDETLLQAIEYHLKIRG